MTQITHFGSFWTQFRVSRDLFTDLTAGRPRFELSYRGNYNYVPKLPVELTHYVVQEIKWFMHCVDELFMCSTLVST